MQLQNIQMKEQSRSTYQNQKICLTAIKTNAKSTFTTNGSSIFYLC